MDSMTLVGLIGAVLLVGGLILLWVWRYTTVGPNEVLVISGRGQTIQDEEGRARKLAFGLVQGGGTFVFPIRERAQRLSLELMTLEIRSGEAYTAQGVRIMVDGVAQVKVRTQLAAMARAAEQFLSRPREEIMKVALQVVEGHLRAVLGRLGVEDVYLRRDEFAEAARQAAQRDLERMGLEVVSLTIRHVSDEQGYLEALGRPRIAQVKRDALIAEAQAEREAEEARRDLEVRRAEYAASVNRKKALADLAYQLEEQRVRQQLVREEVQVKLVEREQSILLEEKEIERRKRELAATVERPAEAERYRIQVLAEAERQRRETEAAGEASALRALGQAEAEAKEAVGRAEAVAMDRKAQAWKEYNQAAITDKYIEVLPQVASAVAQPLARTDRIVIVSNDGNGGAGASRITGDVTNILAQLPTLVESLSGVDLGQLVKRLPGVAGKPANGHGSQEPAPAGEEAS